MTDLATIETVFDYVFDHFQRPDLSPEFLLDRAEKIIGVKLPQAYRKIAGSVEGREPAKQKIAVENAFGDDSGLYVGAFLTLYVEDDVEDPELRNGVRDYGMIGVLADAQQFSPGCVPFAIVIGGSLYCFDYSVKGEDVPVVYLNVDDHMNKYDLCKNFEEFLAWLE